MVLGSSAFLAVILPCFFRLSNGKGFLLNIPVFETFAVSALVGCVLCGISFVMLGGINLMKERLGAVLVVLGAACFILGYFVLLAASLTPLPAAFLYVFGAMFGVGTVFLAVAWSVLVATTDLRGLMAGCSAAFLGSMVVVLILNNLPPVPVVAVSAILAVVGAALPVQRSLKGGLVFPRGTNIVLAGLEDDVFLKKPSLLDLFLLLATPTLGLMLHTIIAVKKTPALNILDASETVTGLTVVALFVLLASRVNWKRSILPFVYWVLFPLIAAVLILLESLSRNSPYIFAALSVGVFLFYSLMTLFAVIFQLAVVSQGEFSPLFSMGMSLTLVAITALLGHALANSGLNEGQRGALLSTVSTAYFIYLLVTPALQLWRTRRASREDSEIGGQQGDRQNESWVQDCDALAAAYGLSRREHEILDYLSRGYNSPYIAKALVISESTVRSHIKSIYQKTGVSSRMNLLETIASCSNQFPAMKNPEAAKSSSS
ncbi:MAG: helix-turn-helix transcriptional regulator [Coriobacteriia bacterium]